jgi:hypothetical protein
VSPPLLSGDPTQYHKFIRSMSEDAFFNYMHMLTLGMYYQGRNRGFVYGSLSTLTGSLIFFYFWR